jgi:hypothetical protein
MAKQRTNLMKEEPNTEWEKMFRKLEGMSDESLRVIWEALQHYDPTKYYVEGVITMDSWAQAVYSEMDHRAIPHIIHKHERTLSNA